MSQSPLQVFSEIGRLRTVMLHKPGTELENLTPAIMNRLLFDDIPDARRAEEEYTEWVRILQEAGVRTLFVEDLLSEALKAGKASEAFASDVLDQAGFSGKEKEALMQHFMDLPDTESLVSAMIRGMRKEEAPAGSADLFAGKGHDDNPLILDPTPNLYFTRDPFMVSGNNVYLSNMYYSARHREMIFARYIFRYHPDFVGKLTAYANPDKDSFIEGGDILLLSEKAIAIGVSQRTNAKAIQHMAETLFQDPSHAELKHVLAFVIPSNRAMMHLDTVFTQLDRDLFVVHPTICESLRVMDISWDGHELHKEEKFAPLDELLADYLEVERVRLLPCGGGSRIDAAREQWNDGSNTLAIAPGEVIVYDRNYVTNALFEEAGVKLHKLPSSEISRGRGGPHCMSMPFFRDKI